MININSLKPKKDFFNGFPKSGFHLGPRESQPTFSQRAGTLRPLEKESHAASGELLRGAKAERNFVGFLAF